MVQPGRVLTMVKQPAGPIGAQAGAQASQASPQAPTRFTVPSMQLGPDTLNISPAWVLNPTSMAGRIIPLPEGQTVDLIPAPEVDRPRRQGELNMKHPSIRCPCGGNAA